MVMVLTHILGYAGMGRPLDKLLPFGETGIVLAFVDTLFLDERLWANGVKI